MLKSIRIRGPREFYGGLALVSLGIFAFWALRDLEGVRNGMFGPGTAPRLFAGLLLMLGAAVTATGLVARGPAIEPYAFRGPACVFLSIVCFALMIQPLGLVITGFATFLIGACGSKETRWIEAVLASIVLTTFCSILFVRLLGLPMSLWPDFLV